MGFGNGLGDLPTFLGGEVKLTDTVSHFWFTCTLLSLGLFSPCMLRTAKGLLQFSLAVGLFSKPARLKAVSSFISMFSSNAWAPAQVLRWLSSPERLSRAQLSLAGCFWLFPSPYNTWYEWATMPSTYSAVTALGVLTPWPSNWKTTPPKPPSPAGAPIATVWFLNMQKISQDWTYFCRSLAIHFSSNTWISFSCWGCFHPLHTPAFLSVLEKAAYTWVQFGLAM